MSNYEDQPEIQRLYAENENLIISLNNLQNGGGLVVTVSLPMSNDPSIPPTPGPMPGPIYITHPAQSTVDVMSDQIRARQAEIQSELEALGVSSVKSLPKL